jgi:hypothetical protein
MENSFASRSWRVEGINTTAEKHSNSGKFALVMKYRTSATHMGKYAPKPFRSSDPKYGVLFDSKAEALRPENVQPFRDFVQVRSAREEPEPEPVPRVSPPCDGERPPVQSTHLAHSTL